MTLNTEFWLFRSIYVLNSALYILFVKFLATINTPPTLKCGRQSRSLNSCRSLWSVSLRCSNSLSPSAASFALCTASLGGARIGVTTLLAILSYSCKKQTKSQFSVLPLYPNPVLPTPRLSSHQPPSMCCYETNPDVSSCISWCGAYLPPPPPAVVAAINRAVLEAANCRRVLGHAPQNFAYL